jgi:hypothetical protein
MTAHAAPYDYCKIWDSVQYTKCETCLTPGNHVVTSNLMTVLEAACQQKPTNGHKVSVSAPPFTNNVIRVTDPAPQGNFGQNSAIKLKIHLKYTHKRLINQ